jgi:hypothetical protein
MTFLQSQRLQWPCERILSKSVFSIDILPQNGNTKSKLTIAPDESENEITAAWCSDVRTNPKSKQSRTRIAQNMSLRAESYEWLMGVGRPAARPWNAATHLESRDTQRSSIIATTGDAGADSGTSAGPDSKGPDGSTPPANPGNPQAPQTTDIMRHCLIHQRGKRPERLMCRLKLMDNSAKLEWIRRSVRQACRK